MLLNNANWIFYYFVISTYMNVCSNFLPSGFLIKGSLQIMLMESNSVILSYRCVCSNFLQPVFLIKGSCQIIPTELSLPPTYTHLICPIGIGIGIGIGIVLSQFIENMVPIRCLILSNGTYLKLMKPTSGQIFLDHSIPSNSKPICQEWGTLTQ